MFREMGRTVSMNENHQDELLREAFRHRDMLVGYAYAFLRDWDRAQDAVQETFIAVSHASGLQNDQRFSSWLRKVTYYKAIDLLREDERARKMEDELTELMRSRLDAFWARNDASDELRRRKKALRTCMSKLRREALEIIQGFYRKRYSCETLAKFHNRSINAIRLTLSRSRKTIRNCMRRQLSALGGQR